MCTYPVTEAGVPQVFHGSGGARLPEAGQFIHDACIQVLAGSAVTEASSSGAIAGYCLVCTLPVTEAGEQHSFHGSDGLRFPAAGQVIHEACAVATALTATETSSSTGPVPDGVTTHAGDTAADESDASADFNTIAAAVGRANAELPGTEPPAPPIPQANRPPRAREQPLHLLSRCFRPAVCHDGACTILNLPIDRKV